MKVPFWVRLKLAWNAFLLRDSTYIEWGKTIHQNTPASPAFCDYPNGFAHYDRSRVHCGEPVTECIGRNALCVNIIHSPEDLEFCTKHQAVLRRERGE